MPTPSAGVGDGIYPIHADARSLPFANDFFDAILSIDSFPYYGTDDHYWNYLARFVKPGGAIGIAGAGLMREIEGPVPDSLKAWWEPSLWCCTLRPGGSGNGSRGSYLGYVSYRGTSAARCKVG